MGRHAITLERKRYVHRCKSAVSMNDLYAMNVRQIWLAMRSETVALWALSGYFFFEYVRPQALYPALDILPWGMGFLVVAFVSSFFDHEAKWQGGVANKLMLVFCLIVLISIVYAFDPAYSFDRRNVFLTWILVYYLVVKVINTEKRLFLFIVLYLLFNFKMAQHGFFSWASRGFSFASHGLVGAPGWFNNSAEFSMQMLVILSLSLAFVMANAEKLKGMMKYGLYFLPITCFFTILGSSSRGSQFALAILALFMILRSKYWLRLSLLIGALGLVAWHMLPAAQIDRFKEAGADETSLQRLAYWNAGLDIFIDHPVIGIGYYNWVPYLSYLYPEGIGPMQKVEMAHNSLVEVGTELGGAGLLIYALMVGCVFVLNRQTRKLSKGANNKFLPYLSYGLDAGLVGFLISGLFVSAFWYPFFWVQFAMTAALYNVTKNAVKQSHDRIALPVSDRFVGHAHRK